MVTEQLINYPAQRVRLYQLFVPRAMIRILVKF
jgi:hypothetical protein